MRHGSASLLKLVEISVGDFNNSLVDDVLARSATVVSVHCHLTHEGCDVQDSELEFLDTLGHIVHHLLFHHVVLLVAICVTLRKVELELCD